jgi:hypothetical protein
MYWTEERKKNSLKPHFSLSLSIHTHTSENTKKGERNVRVMIVSLLGIERRKSNGYMDKCISSDATLGGMSDHH